MAAERGVESLDALGRKHAAIQASDGHNYLNRYQDLLEGLRPHHLVIVSDSIPTGLVRALLDWDTSLQVHVILVGSTAATVGDFHPAIVLDLSNETLEDQDAAIHRLTSAVVVDVLIDTTTTRSRRRALLFRFFTAVRPGGAYVAENIHSVDIEGFDDDEGKSLWAHISELVTAKSGVRSRLTRRTTVDELADALDRVETDGRLLILWRTGAVLHKVRYEHLTALMRDRGDEEVIETLSTRAATVFTPRTIQFHNDAGHRESKIPEVIHVPELPIRAYHGAVAYPRQILRYENLLMPDTFRLSLIPRLINSALRDLSHHHAWDRPAEPSELKGSFYYLDLEYNRHFGHFLTEAIPRLHGWHDAKLQDSSLKLLMSVSDPKNGILPYQWQLLEAFGIESSDVHIIREPVRVERLIAARPLFHNMKYVHPDLASTFDRLRQGLLAGREGIPAGPEKIFVSRKPGMWRECINYEELESWFVKRGFVVVRPELHSLAEQAAIFNDARVVAGYIGSALYGTMFSREPIDLITFVNESYVATNEYFIAAVRGHRMHYFRGLDVIGNRHRDVDGRPLATTNYDYEFDFDADGPALEAIVSRLG